LYSPISQICLRVLYKLYTYDIPVPAPHTGSGKKSQIIEEKKLSQGKKGRKLQEINRRENLSLDG